MDPLELQHVGWPFGGPVFLFFIRSFYTSPRITYQPGLWPCREISRETTGFTAGIYDTSHSFICTSPAGKEGVCNAA